MDERQFTIFCQASSYQNGHEEDLKRQGFLPESGFVAKTIDIPLDQDPPDTLLQAHRFAAGVEDGHTMAIDLAMCKEKGRVPILASFKGRFNGEPHTIRYLVGFSELKEYYWLAVNGASVAVCPFPVSKDKIRCVPTPEQLIGFPTQKEQMESQQFLLAAEIQAVQRRMDEWGPRMATGEMAYIMPDNPEPPTTGPTGWPC